MVDTDTRWGELFGENAQGLCRAEAFSGDGVANFVLQFTERLWCIKRWRIHAHPLDGVFDDCVSELLAVFVVIMHPVAVRFIGVWRRRA
ncbi:MAG: hypothetical protein EBV17_05415 [Actinobacteria bacterium]|nr:hypothetical protein [Actinomycetota bacterium]